MQMTLREKAELSIAMRECVEIEFQRDNLKLMASAGGGPWGQAMICGAVVQLPHGMARKWCRSIAELEEFLEGFA